MSAQDPERLLLRASIAIDGGDRLVKALRARLGARVTIMGGFFFTPRQVLKRIGRAGHGAELHG